MNRVAELGLALALSRGHAPRTLTASAIPSRPGRRAVSGLDPSAHAEGLQAVREREDAYAAWFRQRWGCNLVSRN